MGEANPNADAVSRQALAVFGNFSRHTFSLLCALDGRCDLEFIDPTIPRDFPRYAPLHQPLRDALYFGPLAQALNEAQREQIDEETGARLRETIQSEVERLEAGGRLQ